MSDWIEWKGGDCPVDPDTVVVFRLRGDPRWRDYEDKSGVDAKHLRWDHRRNSPGDIVAYKVVTDES